ncbi:EamA family transporter [Marichromatium bheemlicum]|uniref:DMT family transporter n=1 Tax=Marichromatium bheemlicum TaxID=365339 RepID=A0ABX1I8A8_9GAMM|nr:DMT family transporter [Marichromatium bheemlicum]NKN33789.1 DMT family transporter [Marichromatium bheemlicum]
MTYRASPHGAFLMVLLANVGFAFKGIFAKLALATGITLGGMLMLRIALAMPLYWIAARTLSPAAAPLTGRDWRDGLLIGLLFTLATVADFVAIDRLGAGPSRMLLFTYPLMVQLLVAWRARRWPTRRELAVFVVCYSGLALLFAPRGLGGDLGPAGWIGIACGLVSAASYACFLVWVQDTARRIGSARCTALTNTSTFLVFCGYALLGAAPADFAIPAEGLGWVALMVVIATVLPFLLLFEGIRHTGAARASLIALSGPVITLIAAWAILDERLQPLQGLGLVLIIGAIGSLQLGGDALAWLVRRLRPSSRPDGGRAIR